MLISELAVQQAHELISTGALDVPEKQSIDCILITAENADQYTLFALDGESEGSTPSESVVTTESGGSTPSDSVATTESADDSASATTEG